MKKDTVFKIIAFIALVLMIVGIFIPKSFALPIELIAMTALFALMIWRWIIPSKENTSIKLIISIVIYLCLLSWVIDSSISSGSEVVNQGLMRVSLYEFIYYPLLAIQFFLQPLLFMLSVGGLYGVLSETGKYRNKLEKIAKTLKGKEEIFLVITSLLLAILSSVFGLSLLEFIIIPALCGIILLMGYDKLTAFLTTFIAPLIGIIGSTYGIYVTGYVNQIIGSTFKTELIAKIALFVLSYIVYILFTLKHAKKAKEENEKTEIEDLQFIGEKKQSKKAGWPIFVVLGILLILTILGCTAWSDSFGTELFTDIHEAINEWTIGENTIISYLITDLKAFGEWYLTEITAMVGLAALIISLVYNLKISEGLKAFGNGAKKVLKPAIIVTLAYTTVVITAYHPYLVTITDGMMNLISNVSGILGDLLYILFTTINTIISTIINIDMMYVVQSTLPYISSIFPSATNSLAIITQAIYGLTLFLAPTSAMMLLGLEYLKIPYKEWLKTSWKLVLELLIVILIIIAVVVFI